MTETEMIKTLVENFQKRLIEAPAGMIYTIYGEYLKQEEELKKGVKTDEV